LKTVHKRNVTGSSPVVAIAKKHREMPRDLFTGDLKSPAAYYPRNWVYYPREGGCRMELEIKLHKASGQWYVYWKGKRYYLGEDGKKLKDVTSYSKTASSLWLVKPLTEGQGGEEREPIRPPVAGALEAILPYLASPALELVQLLALTGLRPWEAIRMRPCEIARDPLNPIPIPRSRRSIGPQTSDHGLIWVFVPLNHKTSRRGKFKLTPLGPKAQAILTLVGMAFPPNVYSLGN
jgi:hypothetical protein